MTDFEWKALGDKVSEETEVQAQEAPEKGKRSGFMAFLDIASRAGILIAVVAFLSDYFNNNIERTERSVELAQQKPFNSDGVAMALSYLNREIFYPLCPFEFCKVRPRFSLENLEYYQPEKDEGIRLEKDNMRVNALVHANFRSSDLRKLALSEISLRRTRFSETRLAGSEMLNVDLSCARFVNSDLSDTTIQYKSLSGASFVGTNISNLVLFDLEGGGPQDVDPSEDPKKVAKRLAKAGLTPNTFAGAWAWRGAEPILPKAFRTYNVCDKPEDLNVLLKGQLGRPDQCDDPAAKAPPPSTNLCQQLEADAGMFGAVVKWVDRQVAGSSAQ